MSEKGLAGKIDQLSNQVIEIGAGIVEVTIKVKTIEKRYEEQSVELMQRSAQASEAREEVIRLKTEMAGLKEQILLKELGLDPGSPEQQLLESKNEVRRLMMLIKIHRDQTGHNLCWMNDVRLWREALNDPTIEYPHKTIPPKIEFLDLGCKAYCGGYYESRHHPVEPPDGPMPQFPNP